MIDQQIVFLSVADLTRSDAFYAGTLDLELVLDQGSCRIYRTTRDAFLGICERPDSVSPDGMIVTLVTDDVDGWHRRITDSGWPAESDPVDNATFQIRHAFYRDPDGHLIEIQRFLDPRWPSA